MGIYSDGKVYGLKWGDYNNIIFEKIFNREMTQNDINDIRDTYNAISKNDLVYFYYTKCSSTYDSNNSNFMSWWTIPKEELDKFINI